MSTQTELNDTRLMPGIRNVESSATVAGAIWACEPTVVSSFADKLLLIGAVVREQELDAPARFLLSKIISK